MHVVLEPLKTNKKFVMAATVIDPGNVAAVNNMNPTNGTIVIKPGKHIGNAVDLGEELETVGHFDLRSTAPVYNATTPDLENPDLPTHLCELYVRACGNLNAEESAKVKTLLVRYKDVFAKHDLDLGCFSETKHQINTGSASPLRQKMRRTPFGFEKEEEAHLQKMLDANVIQPSTSEWSSAPVLVRKKDGSVRWCIGYRQLNQKTVKDFYPLPNIDDCLSTLSGSIYFSTPDMESGYYQVEIDPADRKKTAFITRFGLFEHVRMGFGLCNVPATLQRVIQLVLRGLTWKDVIAYLDDVNVLGLSFEEHLRNLDEVLERFQRYNLKLKPRKCFLF